jgi:hypothetical protein
VQCLADAQPDVRAGARRCVAELCQSYQARGERILRGLDAQTQKKILEESERGPPRPTRSRSSLKPSSLSATLTSANGGSSSSTPTSAGGAGGYLGSKHSASSSRGGGGYAGAPGTKMADSKGPRADGDAAQQQQQQQQQPGGGLGAVRRVARPKSLGGAELENLKHSIQLAAAEGLIPPDTAKAIVRGPKRVLASSAGAETESEPVLAGRGGTGKGEGSGAGSPRARRVPQRGHPVTAFASDDEVQVAGDRKGQMSAVCYVCMNVCVCVCVCVHVCACVRERV